MIAMLMRVPCICALTKLFLELQGSFAAGSWTWVSMIQNEHKCAGVTRIWYQHSTTEPGQTGRSSAYKESTPGVQLGHHFSICRHHTAGQLGILMGGGAGGGLMYASCTTYHVLRITCYMICNTGLCCVPVQ